MNCRRNALVVVSISLALALCATSALGAAPPIRYSSDLGQESDVLNWNLFGPTNLISPPFSNVSMAMQVTCPGNTVAASNMTDAVDAGGCTLGSGYQYLFQIPPGRANLVLTFGSLTNFTFNDDPSGSSTVGVLECDSAQNPPPSQQNTAVLCTTLATSGPASQLPNITFTQISSTEFTVVISDIPTYPTATCVKEQATACNQGQGLTLFIQNTGNSVTSPSNVPFAFPSVRAGRDLFI
jgi:hypothetical protein